MKKSLIFKTLYLFLILIVVAISSVFATNAYLSARDISYGSSNVENALNDLYTLKGNDETYSTEEKIVGKWIDGKPIYRKVINGLDVQLGTTSLQWVTIYDVSSLNIDSIITSSFRLSKVFEYIPYESNISGNLLQIRTNGNTKNDRKITMIILEYTKTTDTVNN